MSADRHDVAGAAGTGPTGESAGASVGERAGASAGDRTRGPVGERAPVSAGERAGESAGAPAGEHASGPVGDVRTGSRAGSRTGTAAVDVVCLGESMVTFVPSRPGPLADVPVFHRAIGGAESNVACALARLGHSVRWVSRVGADGFGDHLVATIAAAGVDVGAVRRDPHRPTGVYFRTAGERATTPAAAPGRAEVVYYRKGSAASALSPALVRRGEVWSGRVLHLTGITAALSATCRDLMRRLTHREPGRPLVSFDVNHRPALWHGSDPWLLAELARGCDVVFVGEDEAQAAWGLPDAEAVRAELPEPEVLVVKQGAGGAVLFHGAEPGLHVPAPTVDVVAHVGAGDAFAAGFLSATLRGLPPRDRLRHGHLLAAAALTVPGDLAVPPSRPHADTLAALDDTAWAALRLGPGWTGAADSADPIDPAAPGPEAVAPARRAAGLAPETARSVPAAAGLAQGAVDPGPEAAGLVPETARSVPAAAGLAQGAFDPGPEAAGLAPETARSGPEAAGCVPKTARPGPEAVALSRGAAGSPAPGLEAEESV